MSDIKWAISSDQQIPYQDRRALDLWFQVLKWWKPDVIDIAGDFSDSAGCGRWNDGLPEEILLSEAKFSPMVKEFFGDMRNVRKDAQIMAHLGNHCERPFNYLEKKAPALAGLITPESLWGFDDFGIEYTHYSDPPTHRFGDMYIHHGIYAQKDAGDSVKKMIDEFGVSMIVGHCHRAATYNRTYELRNELLRGIELGHMADIKSKAMSYSLSHNWQLGFAIGHIESGSKSTADGYWPHIQLITISPDYTCVVDGKRFEA